MRADCSLRSPIVLLCLDGPGDDSTTPSLSQMSEERRPETRRLACIRSALPEGTEKLSGRIVKNLHNPRSHLTRSEVAGRNEDVVCPDVPGKPARMARLGGSENLNPETSGKWRRQRQRLIEYRRSLLPFLACAFCPPVLAAAAQSPLFRGSSRECRRGRRAEANR